MVAFIFPLSLNKCQYGIRAGQIFLSLTRFVKNINNICISTQVYYENRFNNLSNDTNYVLQISKLFCIYLVKVERFWLFGKRHLFRDRVSTIYLKPNFYS
jgi:hypothetical protein